MRNEDVVKKFVQGYGSARGSNLYIEGDKLINYTTPIALRYTDKVVVNAKYYSQTTRVHQKRLDRFVDEEEQVWVTEELMYDLVNGNKTLEEVIKEAPSKEEVFV